MVEAGFVKSDGTPNKRGFARRLCELDGGNPRIDLTRWEQNVGRWTHHETPTIPSPEMQEIIARALNQRAGFLDPDRIYQEIVTEREWLRRQVDENSRRIAALEQRLLSEQDASG